MTDYRKITDIEKILDGLDVVLRLNPIRHSYVEDTDITTNGFIAHELQENGAFHAVTGEKDGEEIQTSDYSLLVPLLVAAIQDSHKEIDELRNRITALENK